MNYFLNDLYAHPHFQIFNFRPFLFQLLIPLNQFLILHLNTLIIQLQSLLKLLQFLDFLALAISHVERRVAVRCGVIMHWQLLQMRPTLPQICGLNRILQPVCWALREEFLPRDSFFAVGNFFVFWGGFFVFLL